MKNNSINGTKTVLNKQKANIKPRKFYNTNFQQKVTSFRIETIDNIHFMNLSYLHLCLTHLNGILDRKITKHSNKYQRRVSREIKVARFLGLLPYTL